MSLHQVAVLAYSHGLALSREDYLFREIGLCDWTRHHHVLFKYRLPPGRTYAHLSEDLKARVDRQSQMVQKGGNGPWPWPSF